MVSGKRVRVSIAPPKEVVEKLDELANRTGMTRSGMATYLIVQGLESYEVVTRIPEDVLAKLANVINSNQ